MYIPVVIFIVEAIGVHLYILVFYLYTRPFSMSIFISFPSVPVFFALVAVVVVAAVVVVVFVVVFVFVFVLIKSLPVLRLSHFYSDSTSSTLNIMKCLGLCPWFDQFM